MRVVSLMRDLRGELSIREAEEATGVNRSRLSEFENGRRFPTDLEAQLLAPVYGPPTTWWEPDVLLALQHDKDPDELD